MLINSICLVNRVSKNNHNKERLIKQLRWSGELRKKKTTNLESDERKRKRKIFGRKIYDVIRSGPLCLSFLMEKIPPGCLVFIYIYF